MSMWSISPGWASCTGACPAGSGLWRVSITAFSGRGPGRPLWGAGSQSVKGSSVCGAWIKTQVSKLEKRLCGCPLMPSFSSGSPGECPRRWSPMLALNLRRRRTEARNGLHTNWPGLSSAGLAAFKAPGQADAFLVRCAGAADLVMPLRGPRVGKTCSRPFSKFSVSFANPL